ncbi:hypothetical protein [Pseudomonas fulva]|uniref:hypothetical protein n=1 Tax=Pseudomonas fulva TaxID=47880 RepID=UPI00384D6A22
MNQLITGVSVQKVSDPLGAQGTLQMFAEHVVGDLSHEQLECLTGYRRQSVRLLVVTLDESLQVLRDVLITLYFWNVVVDLCTEQLKIAWPCGFRISMN